MINAELQYLENDSELALGVIIEHYSKRLSLYAFSIVKDRCLAEELVEDVFIALWNNRKTATKILNLDAYLIRATRNRALTSLKKKDDFISFSDSSVESPPLDIGSSVEDQWISKEFNLFVMSEIDKLPNRCKEVLLMAKINGIKQKEIASILNLSPKTVENTLARAIKKLSEILRNTHTNLLLFVVTNLLF